MSRGFVYSGVLLWTGIQGRCLSWRVSNTMDVSFCVEALEEAIAKYGRPEIFNTDQGSQFTSRGFTGVLKREGIRISMDGKRSWMDNVFIERLWRSLKYEEVYLKAYDSVRSAVGREDWGMDRFLQHSSASSEVLIDLRQIRFTMVCLVDYQKWLKNGGDTLKKTKKTVLTLGSTSSSISNSLMSGTIGLVVLLSGIATS